MQHLQKTGGGVVWLAAPTQLGERSTVTALRRVGALIPVFFPASRAAPARADLSRCCAARRPAPALPAGGAEPRRSSWPLPRSARWPLQTEFRRAAAGRALPARPPTLWLAAAGRKGWRRPAPQKSSPSPDRDRAGHSATAGRVPAGSLPPPPAFESAGARRAWPREQRVPAGFSVPFGVPPRLG